MTPCTVRIKAKQWSIIELHEELDFVLKETREFPPGCAEFRHLITCVRIIVEEIMFREKNSLPGEVERQRKLWMNDKATKEYLVIG